MDSIYIIIVGILFILAISDLIVGVSNDAVNFLVSAIGSKSAPYWAIMVVASLGVLIGATFSSGMMEVARKGIFHPEMFYFNEIMFLFLAVMLTDVILLDIFNTFGMPTSTTVSLVFELLGAAVAVALVKISNGDNNYSTLSQYINTSKALMIIFGILVSVVIAFSMGTLVQYIARFVFSFNLTKTYKFYSALWGAIAVTAITYFILVQGIKDVSFLTDKTKEAINNRSFLIIVGSFVAWTVVFQLLTIFTKINVLKIVVLIGTFSLAMAFAGNDLVNFVGVPLAGLKSFQSLPAGADPSLYSMTILGQKVITPPIYLLLAGVVMVLTLWFSKKARSVTETSLNLSRQEEGYERFESTMLSRSIVRGFRQMGSSIESIMPKSVFRFVAKRFDNSNSEHEDQGQAFDLIRASVNLMVSSILIAMGTSLKLPLSTTYVTFMVAMGSSLADGAWGRDSAVYRVTGVISVIGGWFITAFIAFTIAFIFAFLLMKLGIVGIVLISALVLFTIFRSRILHKKREENQRKIEIYSNEPIEAEHMFTECSNNVTETLDSINKVYQSIITGLLKESRKKLSEAAKEVNELNLKTKNLKNNIHHTIDLLEEDSVETGHYYVQVLDYLREITHDLTYIAQPSFDHINNHHKGLVLSQITELKAFNLMISKLMNRIIEVIKKNQFQDVDDIIEFQQKIIVEIGRMKKEQIKRIKNAEVGTKNSLLYFNILSETKNLLLHSINLLKSQRDFVIYQKV